MQSNDGAMLAASVDIGRNALWNYVSLIVWLRWLKRCRIAFNGLPIVLGGLGSWRIIVDSKQPGVVYVGAALALLAGLLPLLYLASGIEDSIGSATHLASGYRVLEGRVRDFVFRLSSFDQRERDTAYEHMLDEHLRLRANAHTVPRWAFKAAERLIAGGDYTPIALENSVTGESLRG